MSEKSSSMTADIVYEFSFDVEKHIDSAMSEFLEGFTDIPQITTQLRSIERKQREVSRIFTDCKEQLNKFQDSLEREQKPDNKEVIQTRELESDSDDDIQCIDDEALKQPDAIISPVNHLGQNMEHLRAALTAAINKQILPTKSTELTVSTFTPQDTKVTPLKNVIKNVAGPPVSVGMKVYGKKQSEIWYSCMLTEIIDKQRPQDEQKYKVRFNNKGIKTLTGKQISYSDSMPELLRVGSRVVAQYREDESKQSSVYAGIVSETPNTRNSYRFLVFFDDGYAQYCKSKEVFKVLEQSVDVWEDVHPDSMEFIKEYLAQYPDRPMVRLQKGQTVKTEWNGRWWTAKVLDVDASLVKMFFLSDKRTESIYRGSTRLEPLYTALAKANKTTGKGRRHNFDVKSNKKPVVVYTRGVSEEDTKTIEKVHQQPSPNVVTPVVTPNAVTDTKKRPVAKKSTTGQKNEDAEPPKKWEAPWLKIQRKSQVSSSSNTNITSATYQPSSVPGNKGGKDIASVLQQRLVSSEERDVDEDCLGERLPISSLPGNKLKLSRKYSPHTCLPACIKDEEEDPEKYKGSNPLLIPMFFGWQRVLGKIKPGGKRYVTYKTPCSRSLRCIEETDRYLLSVGSRLTVDQFCYDQWLHTHTEFVPIKTFCDIKDLSYGKESVPISCVNGIDRQYPDYVEYSNIRIPAKGVKLNLDDNFLMCCDCTDNCKDKSKCACCQLTTESTLCSPGEKKNTEAGYSFRRLQEPILTGVYECNRRCKCSSSCHNRVAQNGLRLRLQVFKTEKRGWGVRCLDDIPQGGFVCIYVGQLLTEQGANEDGQQYGDEYLAELDYIEVVEKHKEGYESDVNDPDDDDDDMDESDDDEYEHGTGSDSSFSGDDGDDSSRQKTMMTRTSTRESSGRYEKLGKLVLRRESGSNEQKEWSVKMREDSSDKDTVDWVNNIPIVIDDEDDSEDKQKKAGRSMSEDDLPDLVPSSCSEKAGKSEDKPWKVKKHKPTEEDHDDPTARKSTKTNQSRFKNLPNPKGHEAKSQDGDAEKEGGEKAEKTDKKELYTGTRCYYGDGQMCYVMDAKSMGNIGRYLNHSCTPNVFVQNVFVDTHDLRFPWVAFYAFQYIRAGTELTWDYSYDVGSVPGKVLYCYCGSAECRGRLL